MARDEEIAARLDAFVPGRIQAPTSRSKSYPYDRPISYGRPRDLGVTNSSLPEKSTDSNRTRPLDHRGNVWEDLMTYVAGPQAPDSLNLGYGMGGFLFDDLDLDEDMSELSQMIPEEFEDSEHSTYSLEEILSNEDFR